MLSLAPALNRFLRIRKNDKTKNIFNRWLLLLWSLFTFNSILYVLYSLSVAELIPKASATKVDEFLMVLFPIIILLMGITPIYFPTILYGFPDYKIKEDVVTRYEKEHTKVKIVFEAELDKRYGLAEQELEQKLKEIEKLNLFLFPDFDLAKLASKMEIPVHQLSFFLNQHFETSFAIYRNRLRMEHAVQLINEKYLDQNTIEALSWECGFASRTSFSKTFKKFVGCSPKEYYER